MAIGAIQGEHDLPGVLEMLPLLVSRWAQATLAMNTGEKRTRSVNESVTWKKSKKPQDQKSHEDRNSERGCSQVQ
jgi:hypothetical protein